MTRTVLADIHHRLGAIIESCRTLQLQGKIKFVDSWNDVTDQGVLCLIWLLAFPVRACRVVNLNGVAQLEITWSPS